MLTVTVGSDYEYFNSIYQYCLFNNNEQRKDEHIPFLVLLDKGRGIGQSNALQRTLSEIQQSLYLEGHSVNH